MGASRTVGLPVHLLYPMISAILLGVAAFPTASAVWYLSVQTNELAVSILLTKIPAFYSDMGYQVRFAATD